MCLHLIIFYTPRSSFPKFQIAPCDCPVPSLFSIPRVFFLLANVISNDLELSLRTGLRTILFTARRSDEKILTECVSDFSTRSNKIHTLGLCACAYLDEQTPAGKSLAIANRRELKHPEPWSWLSFPLWAAYGFLGVTSSVVRARRPPGRRHFTPGLRSLARLAIDFWRVHHLAKGSSRRQGARQSG